MQDAGMTGHRKSAKKHTGKTQEKAKQKDSKPSSVQHQLGGSWWAEAKQKPHPTGWTGGLSEEILAVLPMGQAHDAPGHKFQLPVGLRQQLFK